MHALAAAPAHARICSIASRGRGSEGCTDSKWCRTCSAHRAAQKARSLWSESVSVPPRRMVMKRVSRSFGRITSFSCHLHTQDVHRPPSSRMLALKNVDRPGDIGGHRSDQASYTSAKVVLLASRTSRISQIRYISSTELFGRVDLIRRAPVVDGTRSLEPERTKSRARHQLRLWRSPATEIFSSRPITART